MSSTASIKFNGRLRARLILALAASVAVATAHAACLVSFTSPLLVAISGTLTEAVIDGTCTHVYIANSTTNAIDVVSLATGTLGKPIPVGSIPTGLDISPNGTTLYVANSGGDNLSVVDLRTGTVTKTVPVSPGFSSDTPFSLAVAKSGLVLFSTTFAGSGFGGRMMEYDPATDTVSHRTDFPYGGDTTEVTYLRASSDRSAIGIAMGDISSGPVFLYSSAADSFTPEYDLDAFTSFIALDRTANTVMVNPGTYVLGSPPLLLSGTIPGGGYGVASDPSGKIGYRVSTTGIDVLDLTRFLKTGTLSVGDTLANANIYRHGVGEMAISGDGSVLAVITDHGLSLVHAAPPGLVNFSTLSASATLQLNAGTTLDSFSATGAFTLGARSKGIKPTASGGTLELGILSLALPASGFTQNGANFAFSGTVRGVSLSLNLTATGAGGYGFSITGSNANLAGTTLPVELGLAFGANAGAVTLEAGSVTLNSP